MILPMRRSKIKRQEERRERQRTTTQRRAAEAPRQPDGWTVVHADDVSEMKYRANWKPDWFDEDHARSLAEPAHPSHKWVAMSVADLARYGGPGVTYKQAMARKKAGDGTEPEPSL